MKFKKYIKRFFVGLLVCILLISTAVFILVTFYKKEITGILVNNLKEEYGLGLKIEEINVSFFGNWPDASVQLKNTILINEHCPDVPMVKAGSISLSLDIMKLLKKQFIIETVSIKDAKVALDKDLKGLKNFEFKTKPAIAQKQAIKFEIKKVNIENTQFNFTNQEHGLNIDIHFIENTIKLKHAEDGFEAQLSGNVHLGGLLFKKEKGAFLENADVELNLKATVFTKSKLVFIHPPSSVTIGNHPFAVSSFIELNEKKQLTLLINSKNIYYQKGVALLNPKLQKTLSNVTVSGDVDASLLVIAKLQVRQEPIVIVHISGKKNNLTIGNSKIPYSNVSFNAVIVSLDSTRQSGNSETAKVLFKDVKGNLYDFPFTGSVSIVNFDKPVIKIKADLFINATKINFKPGKEFILKGSCVAKLNYSGPIQQLNAKEFLNAPMKLNAGLFFNELSYQEIGTPYIYTIGGNANLINKTLQFENLFLKTIAGNVILKGNVTNFTSYILGYTNGFKATLAAKTESFNLNPFLSKKENKDTTKNSNTYKQTLKNEQSHFEFNVALIAKKLFIRNVKATNASLNMAYKNNFLDVKSVNMNTCNGKLFAKGTIHDLNKITAEVNIEDMDVNALFIEFENFGQKAIESKNLKGNISVDAKFKTNLDDKMEVIGNTMNGEIKVKVKDGHLLNFEPLQHISDYIFKRRDFNDIAFTEINETFDINGFEIQLHEMEIASSVLNLFVSGKYNLKDNSNVNILVPWNNLKRRGKNYIPKSSGQTAENSKGLKLNYSGMPNKLKLSLGYK